MTKQEVKEIVLEMFRSDEINYWLSVDRSYDEGHNITPDIIVRERGCK